ncbi:flagellin [Magnetospirillum sp. UT-4]|uniref:flagellin n=1 Tax=Magnetospirillum sp. UT-4 TaxID=2681467 RepID=UPI001385CB39|nr:flagellin [Magnetospirillum sp. UT-4]CAA7618581.1 Phase-1 flagellin [Magnetospirillum sp. UT-4]
MTRIGTYGSGQAYLARMMEIQQRAYKEQVQVATEKKSPHYAGIAKDTNLLLNFEAERARANQFLADNALATTRLKAADTAMSAIHETMKNFRDRLDEFHESESRSQSDFDALQTWAWNAMQDMYSYLSSDVDGQYLFSGGRNSTAPVGFAADSLTDFQEIFDGNKVTYPTSRAGALLDLDTTNTTTGDIEFDAATGTIIAASLTSSTDNPLNLKKGSKITISDSAAGPNDGKVFTLTADATIGAGGTTLKVSPLTTEAAVAATLSYPTDPPGDTISIASTLTFAPGADTIVSTVSTGFAAGQVFTVSGSASNDGVYEVESIVAGPPDTITIASNKVVDAVAASTITLQSESWYKGDSLTMKHRVDTDRTVELNVNASDPAFEKAIRAMSIIAQGQYGTAGGLEHHFERLDQALFLIRDALDHPADNELPTGLTVEEESSDLSQVGSSIGVLANLIATKDKKHNAYIGFLDQRIIDIENVDKTEVITRLLDDQRALEAAYQALATVREMSLLKYMG